MLKHIRYALLALFFLLFISLASSCDHWLEPTGPTQTYSNHHKTMPDEHCNLCEFREALK